MHIAGRDGRDAEAVADLNDLAVQIAQVLFIFDGIAVAVDHEVIVSERLNLEIIIEGCEPFQLVIRLALDDRREELARLARTAVEQSLVMLHEQRFRDQRFLIKIVDLRIGHEPVEILHAGLVLRENDLVIGFQLARIDRRQRRVEVAERLNPVLFQQALHQCEIDLCEHIGIVGGAVMLKLAEL